MEQRGNGLQKIGDIIERNIVLHGADVFTSRGFTQVPNHVLESKRISPGAKLALAMLLKFAWQNDLCFPGQERLAEEMGVSRQSVNTYLQELEKEKFIAIRRRGQGRTNIYEINCRPQTKARSRRQSGNQM
jgi:biotin operon repressor